MGFKWCLHLQHLHVGKDVPTKAPLWRNSPTPFLGTQHAAVPLLKVCTLRGDFLLQVSEEPTKGHAVLDLILPNKELVGNVKVKSALAAVSMRWWCSGSRSPEEYEKQVHNPGL